MKRTSGIAWLPIAILTIFLPAVLLGIASCGRGEIPSSFSPSTSVSTTEAPVFQNRERIAADEVYSTDLPLEAQRTLHLIETGGPFPYPKDGAVFSNRERMLPEKPRGYYHEFTVKTPGARDRGARRIISGEKSEYYYTDDHYRSFRRVQGINR